MELLKIGEMAKINHVSEQTLRLYDRLGILSPCARDEENGYRYYDIRQSARLDMIQYLKSMGMSLCDVRDHLSGKDISAIGKLLIKKNAQIDEEIRDLQCQRRAIERAISNIHRYESAPPDGTVILEHIESRQVYCIDSRINFYGSGIEIYEKILRELKNSIIANKLPQVYFSNAGTILRKENLIQRKFISTEVFVFVDSEFIDKQHITEIPAKNYLCIYCDAFDKEEEYANRLLDSIEEHGYLIVGDYICEVLAELPVLEKGGREMFLRLQIPVAFK
ncbi:MerR family transcriptional regulator [Youngiibacter multivorans]|uniref:DNA-binding transcriptional MerR regulator n=1 Tax=Youngiibacter multivorans TaxID=937251 RepID=A0ABS4G507_9CLOT|nr:helix-turn-helix domain-containing protein [Youngiibacter multivorans]MBP1919628.1 DNA-binding transcriptional MerR regulator [Youngiibacter multivorans]